MARNEQPREPVESAVEMAVAAVEDSPRPSPLDTDMDIDTDPTTLGLDDCDEPQACSNRLYPRPAEGECVICGCPADEDFA